MKRLIATTAGAFALLAGHAHAGCAYSEHAAAMASAAEATEDAAAEDGLPAELLARLKRQEEGLSDDALVVPNIPN